MLEDGVLHSRRFGTERPTLRVLPPLFCGGGVFHIVLFQVTEVLRRRIKSGLAELASFLLQVSLSHVELHVKPQAVVLFGVSAANWASNWWKEPENADWSTDSWTGQSQATQWASDEGEEQTT